MWEQNELVIREQHNQLLRDVAKYQLEREALSARRNAQVKRGWLAAFVERLRTREPKAAPDQQWRTRKI